MNSYTGYELPHWMSKSVSAEQRQEFTNEVLTPSNLKRMFWTILCFLPVSTFFFIDNLLYIGDRGLFLFGLSDLILSCSFLLANLICRRDRGRSYPVTGHCLVIAYYGFCLISVLAYYCLSNSQVGETPIYAIGVVLPAVLFHIPPRIAIAMLSLNHAAFTFYMITGSHPFQASIAVWISGSFGFIVAALAATFFFSREWQNYQQFRVIQSSNRELQLLNEKLQSQREEMNHVMALAAHDLRSPLLNMKGLFDMLTKKPEWSTSPYAEVLELSRQSCSAQLSLLQSLLDSYRAEYSHYDQQREALDLLEVIQSATTEVERGGRSIELQTEVSSAKVLSDRSALRQILDNLLSNADKFSPPHAPIRINLFRDNEEWVVEIADEGPGIPPDERDGLFRKFFRASSGSQKQHGAGLGLFIVSQLAESLQARVTFRPGEPHGAVFSLYLPSCV